MAVVTSVRPAWVRRIGLTGGIGSGKSTVAQALVACGAHLIDTDAISRALTAAAGKAVPAVVAAFGPEMLDADGSIARPALRQRVFADPGAKQRLESILHPLIGVEATRQAEAAEFAGGKVLLFDVPLLTESVHWRARVDRVLVVDCCQDTQVLRVARRPGWTPEAARAVIAQQASRAARRAIADAVIFNEGITLEGLAEQARWLWRAWSVARD